MCPGMSFHEMAHSYSCDGYRRKFYFPQVMAPTGNRHHALMKTNRGSNSGLLADYMYMVHFS